MLIKTILMLSLTSLFVLSCGSDPTSTKDLEKDVKLSGVFIINEGGFGHGNGSISFYSASDKQVQNNIFEAVNDSVLGDVVQSMTIIDSLGFIVVNNSHKIVIISLNTWQYKQTIHLPRGSSPRYLIDGGNGFGYVTNLYTDNVAKIDLGDFSIVKFIPVGANPEQAIVHNRKAYIANSGLGNGNTISVLDFNTDAVIKTIRVGDNPGGLQLDEDKNLHVLCTGSWGDWTNPNDPGTNGGIYIIDTDSDIVADSITIEGHPGKFCLSKGLGYFLNNGMVVSYSTETNQILSESFIEGYFNGIAVDAVSEKLFLLDAKDYVQDGELKIFSFNGVMEENYTVGIIPGSVTFSYQEER